MATDNIQKIYIELMKTIRILKGTREVEFPKGISKAELVSIILKWAPRIANDDNLMQYTISGENPCKEDTFESLLDINDILDTLDMK